jgi:hypothetical protein
MIKMTRNKIVLLIAFLGLPVALFFQNCTHTSSIPVAAHVPLFQSATISESLVLSPTNSPTQCDQIAVADILLKIASVSSNTDNPILANFEIVDSDKSISLEKLNLKIKAKKTEQIQNLILNLHAQGNKVLTNDSVVVEVKTPVDEQSVVRVGLANPYLVKEGHTYNLVLNMNPNKLISAKKKNHCLFKPLVQAAELAALQ